MSYDELLVLATLWRCGAAAFASGGRADKISDFRSPTPQLLRHRHSIQNRPKHPSITITISTNENRPPTRARAPSMEITHQDSSPPDDFPDAPLSHPVNPQRKVTPTERKSSQLPSPPSSNERRRASPAADELPQRLADVKGEWQTRGDIDKLTSLPLSGEDFIRLLPELESAFRRFDYDHEHITIRMPSRAHDLFSQFISDAIFDALSELGRDDNAVRPLTSKIVKGATSDIDIYVSDSDEKSNDHVPLKRSPDGQFLYADAELPNVVFEVAYSQDPKQLPKLAKGYIHHSWGDIKAVLCFTISKSKESTISVWKPVFYPEADSDEVTMEIEQVVKSQVCPRSSINRINLQFYLAFSNGRRNPDQSGPQTCPRPS